VNSTVCQKITLIALCLFPIFAGKQAVAQWPRDFQNLGETYFELGAKIYDRPGDDSGFPILIDGLTNQVVFDSNELTDLNGGAGVEARFGSIGPRGNKWEFRTFLTNWGDEFNFAGPNLTSPLSPMLDPDSVDFFYDSHIYSLEFSFRKPFSPGITFLCGPRFVSLTEELLFTSDTNIPTPPIGSFDLETSNSFDTRNSLVGAQIGALITCQLTRDIFFQGSIRTGGYGNFVELTTAASTSIMEEQVFTISDETASFIGEVGGKLYVDLIPGCLAGFVGYEATWIDGIALAPAQASTLSPTTIVTEVTPFFQAINVGLQFRR
jgi:hypothetical protein